jgi:hypothetical protein
MSRRGRVFVSMLAIIGVLTSFAATCAAGAGDTASAQMACCKGGHHHCGTPEKPADCCKTSTSREHQQQVTAGKTHTLEQPVWTPLALAWMVPALSPGASASAADAALVRARRIDTSPPSSLARPAYITFSALLI